MGPQCGEGRVGGGAQGWFQRDLCFHFFTGTGRAKLRTGCWGNEGGTKGEAEQLHGRFIAIYICESASSEAHQGRQAELRSGQHRAQVKNGVASLG